MADYLGDFAAGATVRLWWNTNAIAGESITRATDGSIRIYKDGSDTQRSSAAGITDSEDADSLTGVHRLSIDLSDNTDSGFYAAGSDYVVVLVGATIDGKTINHALGQFSIENRNIKANVVTWLGTAPLALTSQKVNSYDPLLAALIGTGVTFVRAPVDDDGNTEIKKGKTYTGSYRLHYTSDSAADLEAAGLAVKLEFNGESFATDEITGSAGDWDLYFALTEAQSSALDVGLYAGELALYQTTGTPPNEVTVELPELASFEVTVSRNP